MPLVATRVCSTCSPPQALRSPPLLRGPLCQREGDPVCGSCRSGLGAALLWAPQKSQGSLAFTGSPATCGHVMFASF